MERQIAVDSGKFATKAVVLRSSGKVYGISFRTRVDQREIVDKFGVDKTTHSVIYEGRSYVVGENAKDSDGSVTSKKTDTHKIATYAAIAQLVDNGDIVSVAVGCPLSIFGNAKQNAAYKDFLVPEGKQITVTVDGAEKTFGIKKSRVLPEGSGAVLLMDDDPRFAGRVVGVIDIGGLNCNACVYKDGVPLLYTAFTSRLGGNVMLNNIRQAIEEATDGDEIPDYVMDDVMKFGYADGDDHMKELSIRLTAEGKKSHVNAILDDCRKKGWKVNIMPLIFTGGTSRMLRDEISEACGGNARLDLVDDDVEYVNARGFLYAMTGVK